MAVARIGTIINHRFLYQTKPFGLILLEITLAFSNCKINWFPKYSKPQQKLILETLQFLFAVDAYIKAAFFGRQRRPNSGLGFGPSKKPKPTKKRYDLPRWSLLKKVDAFMANAGVALNFLRPIFSSLAFFCRTCFLSLTFMVLESSPSLFCNEAAMSFPDYSGVTFLAIFERLGL